MWTCTDDEPEWQPERPVKTHCKHGHNLREVGVHSRGQCAECGRIKGRKYFKAHHAEALARGKARYHKNRAVELALNKQWREANGWALTRRARKYGLEKESVREMLKFGCGICGGHKRLVIDHDHDTGKVRGVLCDKCNKGLGFFQTQEILQKAMDFLRATGLYSAACVEGRNRSDSAPSVLIHSAASVGGCTSSVGSRP